jgi:predicted nucleotidyltransferase
MKCVFGSHLYGLQTENSDKDYKGIYLPTKDQLLLGDYKKSYSESTGNDKSKNTKDDVDVEIFSLPYFVELACKGETVALDMLHAKDCSTESDFGEIWYYLQKLRKHFYTKNMKSYIGYARKQANKYGIKGSRMGSVEKLITFLEEYQMFANLKIKDFYNTLPENEHLIKCSMKDKSNGEKDLVFYEVCGRKYQDTLTLGQLLTHCKELYNEYGDRAKQAKDNLGVDFKAVSHALRASYQMLHILQDGDFEYPLPETDFLLQVKKGELNFAGEIQPVLDDLILKIETLAEQSSLPKEADRLFWDKWLLDIYSRYL